MNEPTIWRRYQKIIFPTLAISLLFGLMVWGMYTLFTTKVPGANDFYPRWKGAQLFWQQGIDPYSQEATEAIQRGIYGRLAASDEDQVLFVYPFYTVFLLWPFVNLDYAWVQAVWLVVVLFTIVGGVILCLRLIDWKTPLWLFPILLIWAVVFYNSVRTIILGQFAGPIFLFLIGSLLALKHNRDGLAGALLFWTTLKPQMSFLLIPALLLWAIWQRRWRFIAGLGGTALLFTGLSFILLPDWLAGFVSQVGYYPGYTFTGSPLWVITGYYWPQLGKPVELGLIAALMVYMFWKWRRLAAETAVTPQFLLAVSVTLIITNMIIVRTATTNYIIMYLPLLLLLNEIGSHRPWGNHVVVILIVLGTVGIWALFLMTIDGNREHPVTYLPLPFILLAGLIWLDMRRLSPASTKPVGS